MNETSFASVEDQRIRDMINPFEKVVQIASNKGGGGESEDGKFS